ncbi:MAG: hypothetical protein U0270_11950 [Labilithrix sp.]
MAGKKKKAGTEAASEEAAAETKAETEAPAEDEERTSAPPAAEPAEPAEPPWFDRHLLLGMAAPMVLSLVEMWRVRRFTVDDSYISFRYARNFARGLGLVYNEGERVEGYTNFLWTVLLGIGIKIGIDPVFLAKFLGASCALGAILLLQRIAGRLRPYTAAPCLATWLFATSAPNVGYAVFGLETSLFVALILGGIYLFMREESVYDGDRTQAFPWSGVVFGLAGLTRPEAPMYIGVFMLFLGRGLFARRNLLRGGLFAGIVGAHLLFRHSYYGAWVPNTLGAKTGNLQGQLTAGTSYVQRWVEHTGPLWLLIVAGLGYALWKRQRALLALSALVIGVVGYVILVGGDWMQNFRFLVPFEPLAFLLVDVALRAGWDRLKLTAQAKILLPAAFVLVVVFGGWRGRELTRMHRHLLATEDRFWRMAAGGTAKLFLENPKDTIAIGDIGYVGYATDYPILDLLGLVDGEIAKMPGGYTQKVGREWLDYFFTKRPRYVIVISSQLDCQHPSVHGSVVMYNDPRFNTMYQRLAATPLDNNFAWCIYERRGARTATPPPPPSSAPSPEAPSSEDPHPE